MTQPLGVYGLTDLYPFQVQQVPFIEQIRSGGAAVVWMLEFEPYMSTPLLVQMGSMAGPGLGPLGVAGLGEEYFATLSIGNPAPVERHASIAINTGIADVPAKTTISNRLIHDRLLVRRDLPRTGDRLGGFLAETGGSMTIDISDGSLDYLVTDRVLRDRPIRLKSAATARLDTGQLAVPAMASFGNNFEGRIVNAEFDTDGRLNFAVSDGWKRLDRPIQERLYLGTGGLEGGKDLAGKPPPLAYGFCPNVTPTLIDRIKGIYQTHDGEQLSTRPRDMGVYLDYAGEVDTIEQLAGLTQEGEVDEPQIRLGSYVLCRKQGLFRVAGGQHITADVDGDGLYDGPIRFDGGVSFDGGVGFDAPGNRTHRRYPAGMIYRILVSRARVQESELDIDQMLQFDAEHPFEAGIFVSSGERPTVREVCTTLADSAGAVVVRNKYGQIVLRRLEPAASGVPIIINEANMARPIERLPLPWGAPWAQLKLTFAPNWTVMSEETISDQFAEDDPEKALLLKDSSFVEATHPEMAPMLPDREPLEIKTVLRNVADALVVARRQIDFYAGRWATWRAVVYGVPWRLDVLETGVLQLPRFGMQGGQPLLVIGMEERPGEYETELTLL